jgi:hypothetical protein
MNCFHGQRPKAEFPFLQQVNGIICNLLQASLKSLCTLPQKLLPLEPAVSDDVELPSMREILAFRARGEGG